MQNSRNVCDGHRPFPAELVCKTSEYQGAKDGTDGGTGGDDFLLLGIEDVAEVRPYHRQGRTNDGSIIAKEEAGNGSDGDEEYKVWSDLVFVFGSYEILVLNVRLSVNAQHGPQWVTEVRWYCAHNKGARLDRWDHSVFNVG